MANKLQLLHGSYSVLPTAIFLPFLFFQSRNISNKQSDLDMSLLRAAPRLSLQARIGIND